MWRIPLSDLDYDEAEQQAVADVLRSKWLSMGPRTEEFEARAAEYLGVRHAIAVANGTCALEMAYQVLLGSEGRGQRAEGGEESLDSGGALAVPQPLRPSGSQPRFSHAPRVRVIVPDMTFVATANAALLSGAEVELADIEDGAVPLLSVSKAGRALERAAESGIACIVAPVHYAGFDGCPDGLLAAARTRGARVVEDAAHAIGGRSASGRPLGTLGDIGCFSFFANKNLATGEGGLVVTDDEELAAALRLIRSHGMTSLTWKRHSSRGHGYDVLAPGHNYRITEITAALALVQLAKLDEGNARRRALYRLYRDAFSGESRLRVAFGGSDEAIERSACHILPLLCADPEHRDRARAALNEAGVQTSHHYPPIHTFTYYRELHPAGQASDFPAAECFAGREITLPLHPGLKEVELEEVVDIVLRTTTGH